ncbi:MAG: hypothetical protein Ta2G_12290 [Termitinemataceae bacterium]|nr:MAG: hypothetical protein Ta2G_12290 [Termitinemataceae bacterium]
MRSYIISFLVIILLGGYVVFRSLYFILIGLDKIQHVMFDTPEKKKYIRKKGIIGLVVSGPAFVFLVVIFLIALF